MLDMACVMLVFSGGKIEKLFLYGLSNGKAISLEAIWRLA